MITVAVLLSSLAVAQSPREEYEAWKKQQSQSYADYKQQRRNDYDAFRKKANEEYVQWMKGEWSKIRGHEATPVPEEPKPPVPTQPVPEVLPTPEPVPYQEVVPETPEKEPVPIVPLPVIEQEPQGMVVDFFGDQLAMHVDKEQRLRLSGLEGNDLSTAWEALSDGRMEGLLKDCLLAKEALQLSDWGFISLVRCATENLYGKRCNESVVTDVWLLMQSGYQVRLSVTEKGILHSLIPFDEDVFDYSYLEIEGVKYYVMDCKTQESFKVMTRGFEGEQMASLSCQLPKLPKRDCKSRRFASERYPAVSVEVVENKNLIDYLDNYPKVAGDWHVYANASLSEEAKNQMYPVLKGLLSGKGEKDKVEILLNLVQTGFAYEYDEKQFGGERALFADESLYYPYCDCEDRSILFSTLVRDLVGLEVVLLHFPGHLTTAVSFTNKVAGDWLDIEGKRFVMCDPTYIGAPVGLSMPDCKEQQCRVFLLAKP